MEIRSVKTRKLVPPKDDLLEVIKDSVKKIAERSIVVVTSKVVAIDQGRCIKIKQASTPKGGQARIKNQAERDRLAKQEADWYVERMQSGGTEWMFTIKNNTLVASAGIDKSNANGYFVLWPEKLEETAREMHQFFKDTYKLKEVGVVITDSHVMPLRRGLIGTCLASFGFNPLRNYIGKPDIFGHPLVVSITNVAEGLAAAAVVVMGEASEQTPLAIISEVPWVEFTEAEEICRGKPPMKIPIDEDLFGPMLKTMKWKRGGGKIKI